MLQKQDSNLLTVQKKKKQNPCSKVRDLSYANKANLRSNYKNISKTTENKRPCKHFCIDNEMFYSVKVLNIDLLTILLEKFLSGPYIQARRWKEYINFYIYLSYLQSRQNKDKINHTQGIFNSADNPVRTHSKAFFPMVSREVRTPWVITIPAHLALLLIILSRTHSMWDNSAHLRSRSRPWPVHRRLAAEAEDLEDDLEHFRRAPRYHARRHRRLHGAAIPQHGSRHAMNSASEIKGSRSHVSSDWEWRSLEIIK